MEAIYLLTLTTENILKMQFNRKTSFDDEIEKIFVIQKSNDRISLFF